MARLDHVGIASDDVAHMLNVLSELLDETSYHDETVRTDAIRTHFVSAGSAKLELLESIGDGSPIATFLERRGPGLHHLAFEVDDVHAAFERAKRAGFEPVDEEPRPGADGKLIFFLHPRQTAGVLVEFCESVNPVLHPIEGSGSGNVARAFGSPTRIPCLYLHGSDPALTPELLAERVAPARAIFAACVSAPTSIGDLLDGLGVPAVHLIVDAGTASVGTIDEKRVRSLLLVDPSEDQAEQAGDESRNLLVLLTDDHRGLQTASSLRSRFPRLRLATTSDLDIRIAVIVSWLERDHPGSR